MKTPVLALLLLWTLFGMNTDGATIIAGSGEAGFRAAIAAAQDGDTVMLTNWFLPLQSTVRIDKRLTIRGSGSNAAPIWILGNFSGELFRLAAEGIFFEWIRLTGSPQTDIQRNASQSVETSYSCGATSTSIAS
jgi:hypothetical protein